MLQKLSCMLHGISNIKLNIDAGDRENGDASIEESRRHPFPFFPGCPADVVCGGVDLSGDELGDIIGFHQEGVMVFLLLRQQEGLVCFPFLVYIGNEGAGSTVRCSSAAEHHPAAVAAP